MIDIETEARRILATPAGQLPGCTYVATKAEWILAAQRALDGDTDDLEAYLTDEADEVWLEPEYTERASFGMHHPDSPSFGGRS
jgi:hypothetical protein